MNLKHFKMVVTMANGDIKWITTNHVSANEAMRQVLWTEEEAVKSIEIVDDFEIPDDFTKALMFE